MKKSEVFYALVIRRYTMVENRKKHRQNSHLIILFPTSEGVSEVSAAEGANEASSPEQANE